MRIIAVIFFSIVLTMQAQAQLQEIPLTHNPVLQTQAAAKARQAFAENQLRSGGLIALPFLDDFTYEGPYPSAEFWEDNHAYVNNTMAIFPPSVGVATLEGLQADGTPYDVSNSYGESDKLTSNGFALGSYTAASNVYLSFWYQPKGYGDKPEVRDSLIVEFLDDSGDWIHIESIEGIGLIPNDSIVPFQQKSYYIEADSFLYDGFQFRIRNLSSLKGSVDHWHIDYVKMADNREADEENFNDVAYSVFPQSILKNYTSMPWNHFNSNVQGETRTTYTHVLANNFDQGKSITATQWNILEPSSGETILNRSTGIFNAPASSVVNSSGDVDFSEFDFSGVIAAENILLVGEQYFQTSGQTGLGVLDNDTVRRTTVFADYFAHDDGSAESNIVAQSIGTQVAVEFKSNVGGDSLKAIQMHIPHVNGDATNQFMNLKVWLDSLNTDPVFQENFVRPIYVDSLNGWTTFVIPDSLAIALGTKTFFIGWQQGSDNLNPIPVGFDKNTPSAIPFQFMNLGGGWDALPASLNGAIMIRPVVGNVEPTLSNIQELPALASLMAIYPNPVQHQLFIDVKAQNYQDYSLAIHNALGQVVYVGDLETQISVRDLSQGIYFLKIIEKTSNQLYNYKFIKMD